MSRRWDGAGIGLLGARDFRHHDGLPVASGFRHHDGLDVATPSTPTNPIEEIPHGYRNGYGVWQVRCSSLLFRTRASRSGLGS
jgi:hypothetical protein